MLAFRKTPRDPKESCKCRVTLVATWIRFNKTDSCSALMLIHNTPSLELDTSLTQPRRKVQKQCTGESVQSKVTVRISVQKWSILTVVLTIFAKIRWMQYMIDSQCTLYKICTELWNDFTFSARISMKRLRLWLLDAHSSALLPHFSSADLEPHQSGKPPPRAFQFGIMEFLRTAFGLSIVQWKSLAARAASGQLWDEPS